MVTTIATDSLERSRRDPGFTFRKRDYSYLSDEQQNNQSNTYNGLTWQGNPREYTIGGVLSGKDGIDHFFTQTLSVSAVATMINDAIVNGD